MISLCGIPFCTSWGLETFSYFRKVFKLLPEITTEQSGKTSKVFTLSSFVWI